MAGRSWVQSWGSELRFDLLKACLLLLTLLVAVSWCGPIRLVFPLSWASVEDAEAIEKARANSDFVCHWSAAQLIAEGRPEAVYDSQAVRALMETQIKPAPPLPALVPSAKRPPQKDGRSDWGLAYPPTHNLLLVPLGGMSLDMAYQIYNLVGLSLFFVMILLWRAGVSYTITALGVPWVIVCVLAGQNGLLMAAFLGSGLALLGRFPVLAGVSFGLCCFKPQFAFLIPLLLIVGGHHRAFVAAAITVVAMVGTSLLAFGEQPWLAFFARSSDIVGDILSRNFLWGRMYSVTIMMIHAGAPWSVAFIAQTVSALLAMLVAGMVWKQTSHAGLRAAAAIFATYLCLPLVYDYDLPAITIGLLGILLYETQNKWKYFAFPLMLLLYITPLSLHPIGFMPPQIIYIPPCLWCLLLITYLLSKEEKMATVS